MRIDERIDRRGDVTRLRAVASIIAMIVARCAMPTFRATVTGTTMTAMTMIAGTMTTAGMTTTIATTTDPPDTEQ